MSSNKSSACTLCERFGLRPFTQRNILYYYVPLHGLVSYGGLSVNVLSPQLVTRLIPKRDVTNFLLIHTLLGTSLYIFSRPHLQSVDTKKRIVYSVAGASLFGLGSVLVWAIIRSAIPRNEFLSTVVGLATGYGIARISYDYLKHVDSVAAGNNKAIEGSS